MQCPCKSDQPYHKCCEPFHKGKRPEHPLQLMRSRFSAYALSLADYLMQTTHPANPQFSLNLEEWKSQILSFCKDTRFEALEILGHQEGKYFGWVTFFVQLLQGEKTLSFTERSLFEKIEGKWLYRSGELKEGRDLSLVKKETAPLLPLAYYGNPVLRKKTEAITEITEDVHQLVARMIVTMDACHGMGLAAPQVCHSKKLFIIREPIEKEDGRVELGEIKVFMNAILSQPSEEMWKVAEGCLSLPLIRVEVERPKEITVEYTNLKGERLKEKVSGWQARVIMHEQAHIQGELIIDYLKEDERKSYPLFSKLLL